MVDDATFVAAVAPLVSKSPLRHVAPGRMFEDLLDVLALLSRSSDFSVGCYCEDETRCHRSLLRTLLQERKAAIV